jgi:carboxypeptidase D
MKLLILHLRIPAVNPTTYDTTELAAVGAWHVLQGFLANLPKLDPQIKVKNFNLWTESYGGWLAQPCT